MTENKDYLTKQIITYLGNKRSLLAFIDESTEYIKKELKKDKLSVVDLFSGSGVVARNYKKDASIVYANDLEYYSFIINNCFLKNKEDVDFEELEKHISIINETYKTDPVSGFIRELYSPKDDENIVEDDRTFYTNRNALYIDHARQYLDRDDVPEDVKTILLAILLSEASVKVNTSGVFKGFYKNSETGIGQFGGNKKAALTRILGDIELSVPILSNFKTDYVIFQEDATKLAGRLPKVDLVYIDPPYNAHPYSSNYFMLNLIAEYEKPEEISKVSGIPKDWNRSLFNKKDSNLQELFNICKDLKTKFIVISFSSDGFYSKQEIIDKMSPLGEVTVLEQKYNTFRASRNLKNREKYIEEYLFIIDKRDK